jgi:hypothetical protein
MVDETAEGSPFAALRTREADLEKHLNSGQGAEVKDANREKAREEALKRLEEEAKKTPEQRRPPELGSDKDFQLAQAINQLKGRPVLVSKTAGGENKNEKKKIKAVTVLALGGSRHYPFPLGLIFASSPGLPCPLRSPLPSMTDDQLLRYSRHILLDEIGIEGQDKLLKARVLIVGAGGLGSPVALYLGSAGVGRITIADHDRVDATNLQRQIAHTLDRVGDFKAESARQAIAAINPDVSRSSLWSRSGPRAHRLLDAWSTDADVVTRLQRQLRHPAGDQPRLRPKHRKPLVSGAAIRFDGQVASSTRAMRSRPATPACSRPSRRCWRNALRHHGRVRAAGRHHRQHAGRRGAEAAAGVGTSLAAAC